MKYKEAREHFEKGIQGGQALGVAITAMKICEAIEEKAVPPIEVKYVEQVKMGSCPICGTIITSDNNRFCNSCGVAIRWGRQMKDRNCIGCKHLFDCKGKVNGGAGCIHYEKDKKNEQRKGIRSSRQKNR